MGSDAEGGTFEDDVMDELLDQEGLEIDAPNRMEGDTPLHKAVNYAKDDKKLGTAMVAMLIDAGADPRFFLPNPSTPPPVSRESARN